MKKMLYFGCLMFAFIFLCTPINASEIVVVTGDALRLRSKASTESGSNTIMFLYQGAELTLLDKDVASGNGCKNNWFYVMYGNVKGYVCSEYAEIKEEEEEIKQEDFSDYRDYLKELGFPDSYLDALIELHAKYPEWDFQVMEVNITFDSMVNLEYTGITKGLSLIEDTGRYIDGYKSTDSWSYNYLTDVYSTNFTGGGKNWYAASKETIAYYMDPRNFFNESQIFMFETLSYNSDYHTIEGIKAMLKGTFMEDGYADIENKLTYADAFLKAAEEYNVSPYTLISRVIQEVGANGSTIVSGTVSGYEGYYNFYNISASGNSSEETIANGLEYAKSCGWDNPYKAIVGGASFISDDYLNNGQDSLYLQKWDLLPPNYGHHQYMQNVQAPSTESVKTYNGYKTLGLLNNKFVFTIPVFKNMPSETKLPSSENPNNYLKSLSIDGTYLFESATTKTEFSLNLDSSTTSITIAGTKVSSKSSISGTGSIAINSDKQVVSIVVTAENGDKRTYNVTITRDTSEAIAIQEILKLLNISNDGTYIYGVSLGTDVSQIMNDITDKESKASVKFTDKDGKAKTKGNVASGDVMTIKTSSEEVSLTYVIYGDVNGDGAISAADYMVVKNHIMDVTKLSGVWKLCADVNKDGKVSASDYMVIKNHIMDVKKIEQ